MEIKDRNVQLYTDCDYNSKDISYLIEKSHILDIIVPGDKVLLKPNFVQEKDSRNEEWEHVITHPTIISSVLELVCQKLQHNGEIVIADSPMSPTRFTKLLEHFPVKQWQEQCKKENIGFQIIDLRDEEWYNSSNNVILRKKKLSGDPLGKTMCNLQNDISEFWNKRPAKGYYGADYDVKETNKAHDGTNNWYSVSKTVMSSDVFINLPKMKAHQKAGMTCCLKNLVGINTNKNLLPHHSSGIPAQGGDQYDANDAGRKLEGNVTLYAKQIANKIRFLMPLLVPLKKLAIKIWGENQKHVRGGGWYGNDTLWRSIIDLNKVLFYADIDGKLKEDSSTSRKRYIAIVDGILAGEGNGPLTPDKKECGFLLLGTNPVAVDCVSAYLMGFDYLKIPSVYQALKCKRYKLADFSYNDIRCQVNEGDLTEINALSKSFIRGFNPSMGWIGHIENNSLNTRS